MTISGKSMGFVALKKLNVAGQNGFVFNQINELTKKFYSHLRFINISYYLKFQIPMCHRQFFKVLSQNREYINNFCNHVENHFHLACQKWIENCM